MPANTVTISSVQNTVTLADDASVTVTVGSDSINVASVGTQGPPGVGGGMNTLDDVTVTSVANLDLLRYDSGTSLWSNIPQTNVTDGGNF